MSNFICSECGMTNIDCGYAGYKTPKEIELEKKVHILNEANMKLENELGHLQEQLHEANEVIRFYRDPLLFEDKYNSPFNAIKYLEKWDIR